MDTFEEYLISKKIDSSTFQKGDSIRWNEFKVLFDQMHPKSLTSQKLFLINSIRRKYPLQLTDIKKENRKPTKRPVLKPKSQKTDVNESIPSEDSSSQKNKPKIKPKVVSKPKVVVKPKIKTPKKD